MHISPTTKERFSQFEFWALTSLFSIAILLFSWQGIENSSSQNKFYLSEIFEKSGTQFGYFKHYYIPSIIRYLAYFTAFMLFNFKAVPSMFEKGIKISMVGKLLLGWLILFGINVGTDNYLKAYLWMTLESSDRAMEFVAQSDLVFTLWLGFCFLTYTLVKYGGLLLLTKAEANPPKISFLHKTQLEIWVMTILSALVLAFFVKIEFFLIWITVVPVLIIFCNFIYYKAIPVSFTKKWSKTYFSFLVILASFISWFIIFPVIAGLSNNEQAGFAAAFITAFSLALLVAPALWVWYQYQEKRKASVQVLQQKLGHSTAQLDQLRAQINPHFLFNALNTVYGLALTEQAEKTSDAIEKISEMMRFMLRENQESFISLEKDLDYLKNYMSIQQMRLGPNPNIDLEISIPEDITPTLTIAPMLLIPFVENAFKHGISLQSHSFIKLNIRVEGSKLNFSLYNSTHDRIWLNDPEKNNHGIGMNNVKERLKLLYPDRHLLSVKDLDHTFEVELTLLLQ